jgi:hypothetical protein
LHPALAHGSYSLAEFTWRCGIIDANIEKMSGVTGLYNSAAFNALDMTEKGWVNFPRDAVHKIIC